MVVVDSSSDTVVVGDCSDVEPTTGLPQLVRMPTMKTKTKVTPIVKIGFSQSFLVFLGTTCLPPYGVMVNVVGVVTEICTSSPERKIKFL